MFIVSMPGKDETLAACYHNNRRATESVLISVIEREVRSGSEHMIQTYGIGEEYWSDNIVDAVVDQINVSSASEVSRAALLEILVANSPKSGLRVAMDITRSAAHNQLWYTAFDVLVRQDVDSAWPLLQAAYGEIGKDALVRARSLCNPGVRRAMKSTMWSSERLLALGRMLNQSFPHADAPEERCKWVTPESELRELRASIPQILFERGPGDDRAALERLVAEFDYLQGWFAHAKADEAAHGEIARISPPVPGTNATAGGLPIQEVLRLLDNADYRVIRNDNDLMEVIEDLLGKISQGVGEHVELLYYTDEKNGRHPQHESAIQSYVHCRLRDLIPGRVLDDGTKVSIHREPQGRLRQRTDIEIVAPLVRGGLGTLIIEAKWSHNDDISVSQTGQLGTEYLLKSCKTHGIYLVGWSGKLGRWRRTSGPRPTNPITATSLEKTLSTQAADFCREHPEIVIRPIVFDLEWQSSEIRRCQPSAT